MRLAVISYHASPFATPGEGVNGGMSVYVRNLATHLARSGHDVEIFTGAHYEPGRWRIEPGLWLSSFPDEPGVDLSQRIARFRERVLDALSSPTLGVDALHANYWLSAVVAHAIKHELTVPLAVTFHTLERAKLSLGQRPNHLTEARVHQEQRILGCADLVVCSSAAEAAWLRGLYGEPRGDVVVIEPGIDPATFGPAQSREAARLAIGVPPEATVVLWVGRIQGLKGTALAVEAWLGLDDPRTHLVIVGGPSGLDGEAELAKVRELAARDDAAGRLHLVAPRPQIELGTYYRAADLTIVPSESETFGLVALESLACATPVVATRTGGLAQLIAHGRTGVLVDERTPHAFRDALARLLGDASARHRLGVAGASDARRRTWSTTARKLARALESLVGSTPASCASCA